MGRDIHVVLEKKIAGRWEFFDPDFQCYDGRDSSFFDFIGEIIELGCPEELNNRQLRLQTDRWEDQHGTVHEDKYFVWDTTDPSNLYGFGHVTLEKLAKEAEGLNTMWISADFLEKFYELGGELPEGMQIIAGNFDDSGNTVGVRVVDEDDICLRNYITSGVNMLRRIAEEHHLQEDELRICIAFDC